MNSTNYSKQQPVLKPLGSDRPLQGNIGEVDSKITTRAEPGAHRRIGLLQDLMLQRCLFGVDPIWGIWHPRVLASISTPKIYPNKFVAAPRTLRHRAAVSDLPQTIAAARQPPELIGLFWTLLDIRCTRFDGQRPLVIY